MVLSKMGLCMLGQDSGHHHKDGNGRHLSPYAGGNEWLKGHHDWDTLLCKWKIENGIHKLTETRAKRFLKAVSR